MQFYITLYEVKECKVLDTLTIDSIYTLLLYMFNLRHDYTCKYAALTFGSFFNLARLTCSENIEYELNYEGNKKNYMEL